jgi:nicotinamidase-related amidase
MVAASLLALAAPVSHALAQEAPAIPEPVAVELDASTTAYLVLDMVDAICGTQQMCPTTVPAVADLLGRARAAGVLVVYSTGRSGGTPMAGLESQPGEPSVAGPADKFYGSDLDEILASHGISTVVLVGVTANGAPMYTTFGASVRGYTSVVAQDGISSDDPFGLVVARWQLLNQPGFNNPTNAPLMEGRPTLSRTDLITFR